MICGIASSQSVADAWPAVEGSAVGGGARLPISPLGFVRSFAWLCAFQVATHRLTSDRLSSGGRATPIVRNL
jgi:hypothetical protein